MQVFLFLIFIMFSLGFIFSFFSPNNKKELIPSTSEEKILWTATGENITVAIIQRNTQETKGGTMLVIPLLPFSLGGEKIWVTHMYVQVIQHEKIWEEKLVPSSQDYDTFIKNMLRRMDTLTTYEDIRTTISGGKYPIATLFFEKIDTDTLNQLTQILKSAQTEIEEKVGVSLVGIGSKDAEKYLFYIDGHTSNIYLNHWEILDRDNISNTLIFRVTFRDSSVTEREKYRIIEDLETTAVGLNQWEYNTSTYFVQTMSADPAIFLSFHVARPPAISALGLTLGDPIGSEDHKKSIEFIKNLQLWKNTYGESSREVLENLGEIQEEINPTGTTTIFRGF